MIGVIADDITGANDIGIMFAKHNWTTKVYADWEGRDPSDLAAGADVLVLDTDSRYESAQAAAHRVRLAATLLRSLGCTFYYKKTCSVFRGNIGCEFDALLDTVEESFSLVVAAYPKNGRTTVNGTHFVNGVALAESAFAHDPVNPMITSDLRSIVSQTSNRPVGLLPLPAIRSNADTVAKRISCLQKENYTYVVCDCENQSDLRKIAAVVAQQRVFCGSASLAEELPRFWPVRAPHNLLAAEQFTPNLGGLVVAGSVTPETRAQIAAAKAAGLTVYPVDTVALIDVTSAPKEIQRVANRASAIVKAGNHVVVHATNAPEAVALTRAKGAALGLDPVEISRRVSAGLAAITQRVVEATGVQRLLLAGGDTSASICHALGIQGNWVLEEIQPGLPSGLSIGGHRCLLVLKSGSFGSTDFFLVALRHLDELAHRAMSIS